MERRGWLSHQNGIHLTGLARDLHAGCGFNAENAETAEGRLGERETADFGPAVVPVGRDYGGQALDHRYVPRWLVHPLEPRTFPAEHGASRRTWPATPDSF